MKRLTLILLLLLLASSACSRGGVLDSTPRIGFLLSSMEKERYYKDRAAFTRHVEALGGKVIFESAHGDAAQQMKVGADLLNGKVEALVVQSVDAEAGRYLAREARSSGVPSVAYDRLPSGARFDWFITHDSEAVGRAQAEYAVKALGGKGQVAILRGPGENPVADAITKGAREVLLQHPDIEVVAVVAHPRWVPSESRKSASSLLESHPHLGAILCNSSALARGVVEVLEDKGLVGKVYVAGADADLTNCQWIAQGVQGMDVLKDLQPLAEAAAEVAVALARGESPEAVPAAKAAGTRILRIDEVPSLVLPVSPFDASNLEEVVVGSGFHPSEAIFPKPRPTPTD